MHSPDRFLRATLSLCSVSTLLADHHSAPVPCHHTRFYTLPSTKLWLGLQQNKKGSAVGPLAAGGANNGLRYWSSYSMLMTTWHLEQQRRSGNIIDEKWIALNRWRGRAGGAERGGGGVYQWRTLAAGRRVAPVAKCRPPDSVGVGSSCSDDDDVGGLGERRAHCRGGGGRRGRSGTCGWKCLPADEASWHRRIAVCGHGPSGHSAKDSKWRCGPASADVVAQVAHLVPFQRRQGTSVGIQQSRSKQLRVRPSRGDPAAGRPSDWRPPSTRPGRRRERPRDPLDAHFLIKGPTPSRRQLVFIQAARQVAHLGPAHLDHGGLPCPLGRFPLTPFPVTRYVAEFTSTASSSATWFINSWAEKCRSHPPPSPINTFSFKWILSVLKKIIIKINSTITQTLQVGNHLNC